MSPHDRSSGAPSGRDYRAERERIVSDHDLHGDPFRRTLTDLTDAWLAELFTSALTSADTPGRGIALVALGGYGRGGLWPDSDLDLAVVHRRRAASGDRIARIAEGVWYPVWDAGVHLGHGVRSIDDAVDLVGHDVESSTALLDARLIAGDRDVIDELTTRVRAAWRATLARSIAWLASDAQDRRVRFGDVAYALEPNLKAGGGGLRDAQIPGWLAAGTDADLLDPADGDALEAARRILADIRLAQHRHGLTGGEVLHLEKQDEVAEVLGFPDADTLMSTVAAAARDIDWALEEMWVRAERVVAPRGRRWRRRTDPAHLAATAGGTGVDFDVADPAAVLTHAAATARAGGRPDREVLTRIADAMPTPAEPWPRRTRDAFTDLLSSGPGMIRVVEALDHVGAWERFVPEWSAVRSRAQRTPYHRFTVDRHLLEAVAGAAASSDRVARGDLLVMAALFHDLAKGRGADHSVLGARVARDAARRMGMGADDGELLATLVEHHLLLPEVATRRDLDDPVTIRSVATAVSSVELLDLLAALTEADARATGPAAWTDWKAGLVHTLVDRVRDVLSGGDPGSTARVFPSAEQQRLARDGRTTVSGSGRTLTVVAPDRPRLFSRVAGGLVLAGLNVVSATATATGAMAVEEFTVTPTFGVDAGHSTARGHDLSVDWASVTATVEEVLTGRVAIAARIAARADTYRERPRGGDGSVQVRFDEVGGPGTDVTTVVEVDAPDRIGVLFAITQALADLEVDIRYARIETRLDRVTDAFSIVDASGQPVRDAAFRAEISRAIHFTLER